MVQINLNTSLNSLSLQIRLRPCQKIGCLKKSVFILARLKFPGIMAEKKTKASELQEILLTEILSGHWSPGTKLSELQIAERFGVSRTPVREVLKHLAANHLVTMEPHKGVIVAGINTEQVGEMFEAMAEMEGICARLAAVKMTNLERDKLLKLHQKWKSLPYEDAVDQHHDLNMEFHTMIFHGSHNAFLVEMAMNLRYRLAPFRRLQFRTQGRSVQSFDEHDSVVQAIINKRSDLAYQMMRQHVLNSGRSFANYSETLAHPL